MAHPQSETDYVDFLIGLLEEHNQLAPNYSKLASVPFPLEPETSAILKDIEERLGNGPQDKGSDNILKEAAGWWEGLHSQKLTERERFLRLQLLLSKLDESFSARPALLKRGSSKDVVVGRRWWNHFGRCTSNDGKGPLDHGHRTESLPFPHIRVVKLGEGEWLGGDALERAFRPVTDPPRGAAGKNAPRQKSRTRPLRIGLCAFSGNARTFFAPTCKLDAKTGIYGFRAERIGWFPPTKDADPREGDAGQYHQELRDCVRWAADENIHILLMPELSVCPSGLDTLREAINKTNSQLCLVIPGSFHVPSLEDPNERANAAPIWLRVDQKATHDGMLPQYEKNDRFSVSVSNLEGSITTQRLCDEAKAAGCSELKEDVVSGCSMRLLSTPVGVIGIAICKDVLFMDRGGMSRYTDLADHMLVVSMNPAAGYFQSTAVLQAHLCTAMFYVNAAQVLRPLTRRPFPEAAMWQLPCLVDDNPKRVIYYHPQHKQGRPGKGTRVLPEDGLVFVDGIPVPDDMFVK